MMSGENPHAGKGSSVLLDIGDNVGALVITMPSTLEDIEVELRPAGQPMSPSHGHGHGHGHGHSHDHDHAPPHVAVLPRPAPDGTVVHSAVFSAVPQDTYDLYLRPDGPVRLTVTIQAGQLTEATWPAA